MSSSSKAAATHSSAGIAYSTVNWFHINESILRRSLQILPQALSKKILRLAKPRKPIKHLLLAALSLRRNKRVYIRNEHNETRCNKRVHISSDHKKTRHNKRVHISSDHIETRRNKVLVKPLVAIVLFHHQRNKGVGQFTCAAME